MGDQSLTPGALPTLGTGAWKPNSMNQSINLNFGQALEALKAGRRVSRFGWNGRGMYLWLLPAASVKAEWCREPHLKAVAEANGGAIEALGSIRMMAADRKVLTGWLASQTDMLADDWEILGEVTDRRQEPPPSDVPTGAALASGPEIASDVVHEKNVPAEGVGKTVKVWDLPPPTYSLTDQDFELLRSWVSGQVPLSDADLERLREPIVLIQFADAIGLRVVSSEDFQTVLSKIGRALPAIEALPPSKEASDASAYMDMARILLWRWVPAGR